ncbi:MAG: hypothetical protein GY895_10230 [Phycisphaera sp.]|nr:hypothetical protein [Phycisphaera sp.]
MNIRKNPAIRTLVSAIALALGVNTFAGTAGTTVPPELVKVVPSDALLAAQVQDVQAGFKAFGDSLGVTDEEYKSDPPPNLFFMNLDELAKTDLKLPNRTPVIFWVDKLPLPDGPGASAPGNLEWGMAFKLPGATATNTTARESSGMELHFVDEVVVATSKGSTYDASKTGAGGVATRIVQNSPFSGAVRGSMFKKLASTAKPMLGMGPMLLQSGLGDMTKSLAKADRKDAQQIIQKAIGDAMNLMQQAVESFETIEIATFKFDPATFIAEVFFVIDGVIPSNHGVESSIIESLPSGRSMYYAIDEPTLARMSRMEADFFAAGLAMSGTSMNKARGLTKLAPSMMQALGLMSGGIAGGFRADLHEDDFRIGTKDPAGLMKTMGSLMTDIDGLDLGVEYKKTSADQWTVDLDMKKLLANSENDADVSRMTKGFPEKFDLVMKPEDGMLTGTRRVVGDRLEKTAGTPVVLSDFKKFAGYIIFGLGFDATEMARGMESSIDLAMKAAGQSNGLKAPGADVKPAPFTLISYKMADNVLGFFIRIPKEPFAEQVREQMKNRS